MATRKIQYRPLGVRLRSLPSVTRSDITETRRGLLNLSQKLDQISAMGFKEMGKQSAIEGATEGEKFKAYKVEEDDFGNTFISFMEAPEMGSTPREKAYYNSAQAAAKLQIKSLFEQKLYDAYTSNRADIAGFNKQAKDISDGLLESLREKNPQLFNYFQYDFEQSSITYAKSVYTNWSSTKNDIETVTFQGYVNSGHAANIIKMAAKGEEGLAKAGIFVNNMTGDYLNLGPKEAFIAGNISIQADDTRLGIKNSKELSKDIEFARNTFQKIYLEEVFKQYKGNHVALVKAIEEVRGGTYITKDFFNALEAEGQVIGVGSTRISEILNDDDRDKLAKELFTIFHNETDRVNKLFEGDKKYINLQAFKDQSTILKQIIGLERLASDADSSGLEKDITKAISDFKAKYPTEEGLKMVETLEQTFFNRYNADDDMPGVKELYEEDARLGMLNMDDLKKDTRLTGTTKAKVIEMANSYNIGDKHWTDHNLYKEGLAIVNKMEAQSVGGLFQISNSDAERQEKINLIYRKTFEHLIDMRGIPIGNSGKRINPIHIADTLNKLNADGKIIATKQEFKKHEGGKDQSTGDPNISKYNNLQVLIETQEMKLAETTDDKERQVIDAEITRLKTEQAKTLELIPGGLKALEEKESKFDNSKVFFVTEGGQLEELTPGKVLQLLQKDPYGLLIPSRLKEYEEILTITGD